MSEFGEIKRSKYRQINLNIYGSQSAQIPVRNHKNSSKTKEVKFFPATPTNDVQNALVRGNISLQGGVVAAARKQGDEKVSQVKLAILEVAGNIGMVSGGFA
jgi:hypothetical protein